MHPSAGQLNRTTLQRQLLKRERIDVVDAVARVVALQAQAPASPYLALWARLDRFDPTDLDAYADRARVIRADYRPWVIRRNGDVLPALLVDGQVAGVWRAAFGGIEVTAFHRLDPTAWDGITLEAANLRVLLADRQPQVYGRYGHWWDKELPAAERRILA